MAFRRPLERRARRSAVPPYDGSIDAVLGLAHGVWLPETRKTLASLVQAIEERSDLQASFLCDHLRESARSAGAAEYLAAADAIEAACLIGEYVRARYLTAELLAQARLEVDWLAHRARLSVATGTRLRRREAQKLV
jgi:hypothetical protein